MCFTAERDGSALSYLSFWPVHLCRPKIWSTIRILIGSRWNLLDLDRNLRVQYSNLSTWINSRIRIFQLIFEFECSKNRVFRMYSNFSERAQKGSEKTAFFDYIQLRILVICQHSKFQKHNYSGHTPSLERKRITYYERTYSVRFNKGVVHTSYV